MVKQLPKGSISKTIADRLTWLEPEILANY
jgi:hypothetical protein